MVSRRASELESWEERASEELALFSDGHLAVVTAQGPRGDGPPESIEIYLLWKNEEESQQWKEQEGGNKMREKEQWT